MKKHSSCTRINYSKEMETKQFKNFKEARKFLESTRKNDNNKNYWVLD